MQIFRGSILGQREQKLRSLRGENMAGLQNCEDPRAQSARGALMQKTVKEPAGERSRVVSML